MTWVFPSMFFGANAKLVSSCLLSVSMDLKSMKGVAYALSFAWLGHEGSKQPKKRQKFIVRKVLRSKRALREADVGGSSA